MNPLTLQEVFQKYGVSQDLVAHVVVLALILTRVLIAISVIPFMGGRQIPGRIRISLAMALTFFLYPIVSPMVSLPLPDSKGFMAALFFKEAIFGFLLGLSIAMVFYAAQAAGAMVDNQRQLANAQIFNPAIGSQASVFGVFYYQFAIILFIILGGHLLFFKGLVESFQVVPLFSLPDWLSGAAPLGDLRDFPIIKIFIRLTAQVLVVAAQMAAPVLIAIFIADLILGLTNRIAPMVNVFEMGFNIKGWLGVFLVFLSLPMINMHMRTLFKDAILAYLQVIEWFFRGP